MGEADNSDAMASTVGDLARSSPAAPPEHAGSGRALATVDTVAEPTVRPAQLAPGTRLERFVIEERLGAGAMGVVYAAHDPELDRRIAVKLIRAGHRGDGLRARLYREAQALARVAHPNVVVVHEVGAHDDQVFVAMELVRGDTLRTWLAQPRPVREVLRVLVDAGRGLAAAHAAELVHRDFKPDNVLIGADGRARVTDFGLARTQDDDAPGEGPRTGSPPTSPLYQALTETGAMVGTPVYASPEQLAGERVGPASDQFSFCVTAYEALFGKRPFEAPTLDALIAQVATGKLAVARRRRGVSRRIERAIVRGLAPEPDDRHASMDALLAELTAPPRRSLVAGVAVGVIAAGFAAGLAWRARPEPSAGCDDAGDRMAAVWNPQIAAQLKASLIGRDPATAHDVHAQIERQYARYAAQWTTARVAACRAGADDRRARCLDQAADHLRDNLRSVLDPSTTISIALGLSGALQPVAFCDHPSPDPEPGDYAAVSQARTGIAVARSMWFAGDREGSRRKLAALLALPETARYAPLQAEIYLALGTGAALENDAERAAEHLRTAIAIAETSGEDRTKTVAALELATALIARGKLDDAAHTIELAGATIQRLGGDLEFEAQLAVRRGKLASARNRPTDALPHLEQAIALYKRAGTDVPIDALGDLALVYGKLGRLDEAAEIQRKLVGMLPGGRENTDLGPGFSLTEQCSRSLTSARLADARQQCTRAIAEIEGTTGMGAQLAASPHALLAAVHELLEEHAEARLHHRRAADVYEKFTQQAMLAGELENVARMDIELHDLPAAVAGYRRSIELARALGEDGEDQVIASRAGLGRALGMSGKLAESIAELEWALPRLEVAANPRRGFLASTRLALADALWLRNARSDRARARLLAEAAVADAVAHRTKFSGDDDPLNPTYRRRVDQLDQRIANWRAKHR